MAHKKPIFRILKSAVPAPFVTCSGYSSLYLHGLTNKEDLQKREGIGKKEKEKREKERVKSLLLLRPINIAGFFPFTTEVYQSKFRGFEKRRIIRRVVMGYPS